MKAPTTSLQIGSINESSFYSSVTDKQENCRDENENRSYECTSKILKQDTHSPDQQPQQIVSQQVQQQQQHHQHKQHHQQKQQKNQKTGADEISTNISQHSDSICDTISNGISSKNPNILSLTLHQANPFIRLSESFKRFKMGVTSACLPCVRSPDGKENADTNKRIDAEIAESKKKDSEIIKLLLIGAGESGKTTIIKQMKIIHIKGFTETEKIEKRREIRENIFEAIKELTGNMEFLKPPINLENEQNRSSFEFVRALDMTLKNTYDFPQEFYDHVNRLWSDGGIKACFRRANEFALIDSAKYFLDKIEQVREQDYIPSNQDILQSRRRTSEIQKIEFQVKIPVQYGGGHQNFWMFDVGGQKGERRKWIQVFAGIRAIVFVIDCSSYDTNLREDDTKNRLRESLELFEDIWFSRYLINTGFILFLNKQDMLKEKIECGTTKIVDYFPEYSNYKPSKEPQSEFERVRNFIRDMFLDISKQKISRNGQKIEDIDRSKVFTHFTTATDTNNISLVFNDVHAMFIIDNLGAVL